MFLERFVKLNNTLKSSLLLLSLKSVTTNKLSCNVTKLNINQVLCSHHPVLSSSIAGLWKYGIGDQKVYILNS